MKKKKRLINVNTECSPSVPHPHHRAATVKHKLQVVSTSPLNLLMLWRPSHQQSSHICFLFNSLLQAAASSTHLFIKKLDVDLGTLIWLDLELVLLKLLSNYIYRLSTALCAVLLALNLASITSLFWLKVSDHGISRIIPFKVSIIWN